jgi:hypothetical protein
MAVQNDEEIPNRMPIAVILPGNYFESSLFEFLSLLLSCLSVSCEFHL